jgi:hypothetical protein
MLLNNDPMRCKRTNNVYSYGFLAAQLYDIAISYLRVNDVMNREQHITEARDKQEIAKQTGRCRDKGPLKQLNMHTVE